MTFKDLSHLTPSLEQTPPAKKSIAHRQIHVKVERSGAISFRFRRKKPKFAIFQVVLSHKLWYEFEISSLQQGSKNISLRLPL